MMRTDKIHQLSILTAAVLLVAMALLTIVLIFDDERKCVRISMSVRPWPVVKRTQGLPVSDQSRRLGDPIGSRTERRSAWFRTRIVLPSYAEEDEDFVDAEEETVNETIDDYDEYYDEDLPENRIFEVGDFDYNDTRNRMSGTNPLDTEDFGIIRRIFDAPPNNESTNVSGNFGKTPWRNITLVNVEGVPVVEDGIFWSEEMEKKTPKGEEDEEARHALKKLRTLSVQRVEPPSWNRCGRPKNQFVTYEDGSKACARYRAPHQYLVQGEVLSFYLARLLGIDNVPVVSLATVGPDFRGMWSNVKEDLAASEWEVNTTVALIQWIENLERDRMPAVLLSSLERLEPLSARSPSLLTLRTNGLAELVQWSDLIVFDYITGNYDRVASMQDAADRESRPSVLGETVHNLGRSRSTGALWFIDNESGLLDGYSLLRGKDGARFVRFHDRMLGATCLFRRSTAERIRWLHASGRAGPILAELVERLEPLSASVGGVEELNRRLQERIGEVHRHMEGCSAAQS